MARVPYIEQMEYSECGLACLAMILGYYKHSVTLSELRDQFDPPRDGVSFYHLREIAHYFDLKAKAYQVQEYQLDQLNADNFPLPFIAHWDEGKHFVVVEKMSQTGITIVDPAFGKRKISKEEFQKKFSGSLLSLTPGSNFIRKKKARNIGFFLSFANEHKKWIFGVFFVSILLQILGIIIPFLIKNITDNLVEFEGTLNLNKIGIGIFLVFISYFTFTILRGYLITKLQRYLDDSLMNKFIGHLFRLPYIFFEKRTSGDLLFRANSHVIIRQLLSVNLIAFFIDTILVVTYAVILIYFSFKLAMIVILLGISTFILLMFSTPITLRLTNRNVLTQSRVQSFLAENINSVTNIKVMGLENRLLNQWNKKFEENLDIVEKNNMWNTFLDTFSSGIQFILPLFLLWIGGFSIVRGEMSLGDLLAFSSLAGMFISPILSIGSGYIEILQLSSIFQRLFDVFDNKLEQEEQFGIKKESINGKVELRNVSFKFDRFGEDVISDINLTINPGEKIGIVGESGSGKSTLVKLIIGLYKHTQGEILIDDIPIENFDLQKLRSHFGVVLQETNLYHNTISENIGLKDEDLNQEDILWAAKSAEIHPDIMKLPLGYNTLLSETGVNFSGGQRQRLLLARSLYKKPPILILDEATSSLDTINESKIDQNISEINSTRVIVAHRLSTIKNSNKIIVMDQGKIVESGTHDQLIQKKGKYYHLYQYQLKEENSPS